MQLVTEQQPDKQRILIVDKSDSFILSILKSELSKFDNEVFVSPKVPPSLDTFSLCYIINEKFSAIRKILQLHSKIKIIFIFTHKHTLAKECETYIKQFYPSERKRIKCIDIESDSQLSEANLENIIWFSFSDTSEILITINKAKIDADDQTVPQLQKSPHPRQFASRHYSAKHFVIIIALLIFIFHLAFIPPLAVANYFFYTAGKSLMNQDITASINSFHTGQKAFTLSKQLYALIRPTFQLFSFALLSDNIMQFNDTVSLTLEKALVLDKEASTFISLLFKKNKSVSQVNRLKVSAGNLKNDLDVLNQYLNILSQKLPNWKRLESTKKKLQTASEEITSVQKLMPHLNTLLADNSEKKYLLLFANNMELRPGGGFIGSFGIIKVHNYTVEPVKVYDVYDADGQLKTHIDPPDPIRLYLQQPHWFLRDSAWSPDFEVNYKQAQVFLKEELGATDFDGGILITTTTIQNILEAMGEVYVPDFKEKVNKDNFYIKAQLYSEKNFFPGSTQKKRFLGAVADQILLNLESAPEVKLMQMIKKSLEEKQMVMYFNDASLQQKVNSLYWSGQILVPKCPTAYPNCINNYLLPYEANLGVNKANFFVKKLVSLKSTISKDGVVTSKLQITLINNSFNTIFPGGSYKNYFQLVLPLDATVNRITQNDTLVENYDTTQADSKTIGMFLEIPAQSQTKLSIDYTLNTALTKGKGAYQLVLQKQIGSGNSEFKFELTYPENIYNVSQNFSPLVKDNGILYNTTLTADKIFFIELIKD